MGVFSRIKIDVPSGMASTNRSLGSQPVSIPLVEPLRPAWLRRPDSDELFDGPFSSGRRSRQDAAFGKDKEQCYTRRKK